MSSVAHKDRIPYQQWVSRYAEFGDYESLQMNINTHRAVLQSCDEKSADADLARERLEFMIRQTIVIEDLAETLSYMLLGETYTLPSGGAQTKVRFMRDFLKSF